MLTEVVGMGNQLTIQVSTVGLMDDLVCLRVQRKSRTGELPCDFLFREF